MVSVANIAADFHHFTSGQRNAVVVTGVSRSLVLRDWSANAKLRSGGPAGELLSLGMLPNGELGQYLSSKKWVAVPIPSVGLVQGHFCHLVMPLIWKTPTALSLGVAPTHRSVFQA